MIALGIDCGTQSLKSLALDEDSGLIIASASRSYDLIEGLPAGHLEQNPETWWKALQETVGEVLAAIGTGNVGPGCVTASLGTSGTIFACSDHPVVDPEGEVAAFCDSNDRWLPLLCTMNVTVATELFRKMFGWDHARMEREIASVPSGAHGLVFLPYLQGERTPNLPDGCGVLHGMNTSNTTPAHLARAVMEGVTLGMAYGLRRMEELGVKPDAIRLTGGGSNSLVWRQMCADIFGYPVVKLKSAEGGALGAAIQALATAGGEPVNRLAPRFVRVEEEAFVEPYGDFDYGTFLERQNQLRGALFMQPHA